MRLSQKYADHSAELTSILEYLTDAGTPNDNATRLGIAAEEITNFATLRTAFMAAYAAYTNPTTHNSITVGDMKVADDNIYAIVLPLRQRLKNGTAELTPADYANLGIHEDKTTRTPKEVPTDTPTAVLVESKPMALTFEATMQSTEGVNRLALPPGCRVAREIAVLAQGTEPTEADYHMIDSIGRSRFTIMFTAPEAGMNVHLRIAYANTAGRGPWSQPVKAIII